MTAFVSALERADPRSPSYDESEALRAAALALGELAGTPEAVALARIARVARREAAALDRPAPSSPYRGAFNLCIDAFALARDELENLVHLACLSSGLDRAALPSTGEMVDRLAACVELPAAIRGGPAQDGLGSSPIHCSERYEGLSCAAEREGEYQP